MDIKAFRANFSPIVYIAILTSLLTGLFYMLFLPILYTADIITAKQLGYIGSLLIIGLLTGAILVTYKLHTHHKKALLWLVFALRLVGTACLFWYHSVGMLVLGYVLVGIGIGIGVSTFNALSVEFTSRGNRYGALAKISMLGDVIRVTYPLVAGAVYAATSITGIVVFGVVMVLVFGWFLRRFLAHYSIDEQKVLPDTGADSGKKFLFLKNRSFMFIILLEFLDSLASSNLFVFLPTLLIMKNFTIQNALVFQSIVFLGYFCGRWIVGKFAKRFDGFRAVGVAEAGMAVMIVLLLITPASLVLYLYCFLLGICVRGTSPVLKALSFDQLDSSQVRQGGAMHVIGGDSGSAVGQFLFGMLLAWFGVTAPFVASAVCATLVAIACFAYWISLKNKI